SGRDADVLELGELAELRHQQAAPRREGVELRLVGRAHRACSTVRGGVDPDRGGLAARRVEGRVGRDRVDVRLSPPVVIRHVAESTCRLTGSRIWACGRAAEETGVRWGML